MSDAAEQADELEVLRSIYADSGDFYKSLSDTRHQFKFGDDG